MNILEIIERKAIEMRDGECWETTHKSSSNGYCRIKQRKLHRVAWEAYNAEPIPPGMMVCHTCDNRRCFNPEHLFLGTAKDNHDDCVSKGRATFPVKPRTYDYSLVHQMFNDGSTIQEIATLLGAHWTTIKRIVSELLAP